MDKAEHGRLLKSAMSAAGVNRQAIADATGVRVRTVTNWTRGETWPSESDRAKLRRLLGPYDDDGDAVELALSRSTLNDWRQDAVRSVYRRHLHEQRAEDVG